MQNVFNSSSDAGAPASAAVFLARVRNNHDNRENDKALNLLKAGAASVIFYDNRPYPAFKQSMNIDESIGRNAPQMFCVDQDTGLALTKALEAGTKITLTRVSTKKFLNPNADRPSWFSSWGPVSCCTALSLMQQVNAAVSWQLLQMHCWKRLQTTAHVSAAICKRLYGVASSFGGGVELDQLTRVASCCKSHQMHCSGTILQELYVTCLTK
jgi:hypothetical protein